MANYLMQQIRDVGTVEEAWTIGTMWESTDQAWEGTGWISG